MNKSLLHSDLMPQINYSPPISDLFANLQFNMSTLSPALVILFGILFAGYLIKKIKDRFIDDDDD